MWTPATILNDFPRGILGIFSICEIKTSNVLFNKRTILLKILELNEGKIYNKYFFVVVFINKFKTLVN